MEKEVDIGRVVAQHKEMEDFLSGGFTVAGVKGEVGHVGGESASVGDSQKVLEEVAAEVGECCRCGLGASRTHGVPGEGNPGARIVFVGEAPGEEEDLQGRPFVGRAGQLLDKMIGAMGLKRSDVFICNILKCRPPGNRDPRPEEIVRCLPYLKRQLEAIRPEVIIALGAHAARTLLNTNEPIGHLRGRFREYYTSPDAEPIKVMATYHPAYLLRSYSPENRRRVWEDLQKVMEELGLPGAGAKK